MKAANAMKTVLLDTNIVLDVWLRREPFAQEADPFFVQMEAGRLRVFLCATTITTLDYVAGKNLGRAAVRQQIQRLLTLVDIAPVNRAVLDAAASGPMPDFEDAVLAAAAIASGVSTLITRNPKDFASAPAQLRIYSPAQWLAASI